MIYYEKLNCVRFTFMNAFDMVQFEAIYKYRFCVLCCFLFTRTLHIGRNVLRREKDSFNDQGLLLFGMPNCLCLYY